MIKKFFFLSCFVLCQNYLVFSQSKSESSESLYKKRIEQFGILPKCQKGYRFRIGFCYKPCPKGFKGIGRLCFQHCKEGHRDLGATCHKKGHFSNFYSKKTSTRKRELPLYRGVHRPKTIRHITDKWGRVLILRGINSSNSSKSAHDFMPWVKKKHVIQETKEFGFNVVRFLIFWAAIEPEKGVFDEEYLDRLAKRIKWYTDNGAYVFLDMHQDVYGYSVRGNGAPPWATEVGPYKKYQHKKIGKKWWLQNINPAVTRAYSNFWRYKKYKYLQDHYIKAWEKVAKRFKGNPKVIGYDLMNEPHSPDITPFFEKKRVKDFYHRVIRAIRKIDQDKWLFIEPRSFMVNFGLPSFLPKITDSRQGESRLVYAPHLYPLFLHEGTPYQTIDRKNISDWSINRTKELERLKTPLLVGEFGGSDNIPNLNSFLEEVTNMFDYMQAGWTWYSNQPGSWALVKRNGQEYPKVHYLVRTYPRAISGTPHGFFFDIKTGEFQLFFKTKKGVKAPTEIFIPKRHYPQGFNVQIYNQTAESQWEKKWDPQSQILYIKTEQSPNPYTITITRKK